VLAAAWAMQRRQPMLRALALMVAISFAGCAPAAADGSDEDQGALSEQTTVAKVRFGTFEYRYPGREGLVKRLVLREARDGDQIGTFERTEWRKEGRRLVTSKVTGTFSTSTKAMPEFTRLLIHFKGADSRVETYRYKHDDDGELVMQPDRDGAPRTSLMLFEAPNGAKALYAACKATEVFDMTIFEESFSVDEYPSVDLYRAPDDGFTAVSIGASGYSAADGDVMTVSATADALEGKITSGDVTHVVRVRGTSGEVVTTQDGETIKVAQLRCKTR
jgi:hypothetical protein